MDKPTKYFDSARKPCKKTGNRNSSQMAYLTEKLTKLKKKLNESKKHSKKCARDSSDSDLDSGHERVYGSTGNRDPADKHLKLEQPNGIHLISTDTRPIKATKLAPETSRANEIAIENSKTGKMTAVFAMLKVFGDKINNSRNANLKKLLNKPNKWLNSKKKALNRPKKHLKRLHKSIDDASKGILVKQKNYKGTAQHRIEW